MQHGKQWSRSCQMDRGHCLRTTGEWRACKWIMKIWLYGLTLPWCKIRHRKSVKSNFMSILCQFNSNKLNESLFGNNCPLNDKHSQWTWLRCSFMETESDSKSRLNNLHDFNYDFQLKCDTENQFAIGSDGPNDLHSEKSLVKRF